MENALNLKLKEKEKFEKLSAMPPVEVTLADKYKFEGPEPTHDKDGNALEGKAKDKARKEVEKAKKILEPLNKKLGEDPDFMSKLAAEVEQLTERHGFAPWKDYLYAMPRPLY
eukprot:gene18387-24856_t